MARYRISYGLGGGFNVRETDEVEANNVDQATEYAYIAATELFEFYGVFKDQNPDYDENSEDYEQDYEDEMQRWLDYTAELVSPGQVQSTTLYTSRTLSMPPASAFQLAQIFEKIQFIGAIYRIVKVENSYYRVEVTVGYTEYNDPIIEEFYIYKNDEDTDIDYINEVLDRQIEKQEEEQRKYERRKKLLASMSQEDKKLLGLV